MDDDMVFKIVQTVCKYYTLSFNEDHQPEDACHYRYNIPKGDSWGVCSKKNCPYLSLKGELNE